MMDALRCFCMAWLAVMPAICGGNAAGQADLVRYAALLDNRWSLADLPEETRSIQQLNPVLRDSILEPDAMELQMQSWADLDSLENVMVQWLLGNGMENLQKLAWLYDGYCLPLRDRLEAEGLPVSMACLPLMLTACDPSYLGPGNRAGIWALPQMHEPVQACDDRHQVDVATDRAIETLTDLSAANPGDPLQVMWSFMRAGRPEAACSHPAPLESKVFDEWISLYRVLVRFLENFEREEHRGTWLLTWSGYEEVQCPGALNRISLRSELGWNRRTQQTWLPGWNGDSFTCETWANCPVGLPKHLATQWKQAFADGIHQPANRFPETLHKVVAGESLGGIARAYGVDLAEIVTLNNLAGDGLQIDQTLLIPALQ